MSEKERDKTPYSSPKLVALGKKGDEEATRGCSHGNQIDGDCTTGGYPKGQMADCRNGVKADNTATCQKGSRPGVT